MNRALSTRLIFLAVTIWRTTGSVLCGPVMSQKRASSVWAEERLVLLLLPSSRISM